MRAVGDRELRQGRHLLGRRAVRNTDVGQVTLVERGQDRHCADAWTVGAELGGGFGGGGDHLASADGMDRHQIDAQASAGTDGLCGRVGDVVELEVQKDLLAEALDRLDDIGTLGREQLQADLVEVHRVAEQLYTSFGFRTTGDIQCDNQFSHFLFFLSLQNRF